jgi:hypothetical protein
LDLAAIIKIIRFLSPSLHFLKNSLLFARPSLIGRSWFARNPFSEPADLHHAAARSLRQAWPKAAGRPGEKRA